MHGILRQIITTWLLIWNISPVLVLIWYWSYCNWLNFKIRERNQLQVLKSQTDICDSYIIKSQLFWKIIILSLAQVIWIGHIPVYPHHFGIFSCMPRHCIFVSISEIYCWILTGGSWRKRAPRSSWSCWNSIASRERLKLILTTLSAVWSVYDLFCEGVFRKWSLGTRY